MSRKVTIYRDDSTVQVVYERVKATFWTARNPWERTEWYPPSIKPARVGVYQRDMQDSGNGEYSFWDGECWGGWGNSIEIARNNAGRPSSVQDANWRGLAQEPT